MRRWTWKTDVAALPCLYLCTVPEVSVSNPPLSLTNITTQLTGTLPRMTPSTAPDLGRVKEADITVELRLARRGPLRYMPCFR